MTNNEVSYFPQVGESIPKDFVDGSKHAYVDPREYRRLERKFAPAHSKKQRQAERRAEKMVRNSAWEREES